MAQAELYPLERELEELRKENETLRGRLEAIEARADAKKKATKRLMRGGFRILVPLLDRQRVVRSFSKLAETASGFAGAPSAWPTREEMLADSREFMESVVRFMIRRRLILFLFSLLAGAIPAIQIWLVFQQNEIIQNQNEFFEIQVYDVVARSMTEGDRNARLMTGALLARSDTEFLSGVVAETFDSDLAGVYRAEGVHASRRRLEDAAFRGNLVRAVARSVERRYEDGEDPDVIFETAQPMFERVLRDGASRVPEVLFIGRQLRDDEGNSQIDDALAEQVDHYLAQIGFALSAYGRLARSAGEEDAFYRDIAPLLSRLSGRRSVDESRFGSVYRTVMQDFLFEVAVMPELGDPAVRLDQAGVTPAQAVTQALDRLESSVEGREVNWDVLREQLAPR